MRRIYFCTIGIALFSFISLRAPDASEANSVEITNAQALIEKWGIQPYLQANTNQVNETQIKVAVLDNGFAPYDQVKALLPESTEIIYGPKKSSDTSPHGLRMAQILWALTGKNQKNIKFFLVHSNGFTNFKAAVDFVIKNKIDIVLYSSVWPIGANFDGTGLINGVVKKATEAGVIWINAAGDYHKRVYEGQIVPQLQSQSLILNQGDRDYLRFQNVGTDNTITVTLSWNDFFEDDNGATQKDLDLYVFNSEGDLVGSSERLQDGDTEGGNASAQIESYAFEKVILKNPEKGEYRIKVGRKGGNFVATDRYRVLIHTENYKDVYFQDHTERGEIFSPADLGDVITVSDIDADSSVDSRIDPSAKPDLFIPDAVVHFSDNKSARSSSVAAAMFAGIVSVLKFTSPKLTSLQLRRYVQSLTHKPADMDHFKVIDPHKIDSKVRRFVPPEAVVFLAPDGHFLIGTREDPSSLPFFRNTQVYRHSPDEILVADPVRNTAFTVSAYFRNRIRSTDIEFRQVTGASKNWVTPSELTLKGL